MTLPDNIHRSAHLSDDRTQRFWLERRWGPHFSWTTPERKALWIMHNPSAADETKDDPTVRRVIEFTQHWGLRGAIIVNLIPHISATPADAHAWEDEGHLTECRMYHRTIAMLVDLATAGGYYPIVIAAWGAIARPDDVARFISEWRGTGRELSCIGQTASGAPIHPLARGRNRPPLADPQPYWSPS